MAGLKSIITVDTTTENGLRSFDSLEAVLVAPVNLSANWDRNYGHVVRGHLLERYDATNNRVRPLLVGKVTAVNGTTVTLDKGAAVGPGPGGTASGLVGKQLKRVTAAGVIGLVQSLDATPVARTVASTTGDGTWQATTITFSGAHNLVVGDYVGSESVVDATAVDGISYESINADDNPQVAVMLTGMVKVTHVVGASDDLPKKWRSDIRRRGDVLIVPLG